MNKNMIITFLTLRKVVGILGVSLAFIVMLGGWLFGTGNIETSISAYYNTNMRDILVAVLAIAGAFLVSYHGYDSLDNLLSKIAGISAILIGLFPLNYVSPGNFLNIPDPFIGVLHYLVAATFFITIALMSLLQFTKGKNKVRNLIYTISGYTIVASIVITAIGSITGLGGEYLVMITEIIMLLAFGVSWFVKGQGFLKDK